MERGTADYPRIAGGPIAVRTTTYGEAVKAKPHIVARCASWPFRVAFGDSILRLRLVAPTLKDPQPDQT
jgi:hypothetical protein